MDVALCRKAIIAFWHARAKAEAIDIGSILRGAVFDAEYLSEYGDEGLRYGALGWPHLKLRYQSSRGFYLDSNGMPENDFLIFQQFFAAELEKHNLPFHKMSC